MGVAEKATEIRMKLHTEVVQDLTWGFDCDDALPTVGPIHTYGPKCPTWTVHCLPGFHPAAGTAVEHIRVVERGGQFDVIKYEFEGFHGLWHGGGGNWVLWEDNPRCIYVSVPNTDRGWPTARFVLRHLYAATMSARPDHQILHAAVAVLPGSGHEGVLVCGSSGTGKSYIVRTLQQSGLVTACPEDDCTVLDPYWNAICLMPTERERGTARLVHIRTLLCLDPDVVHPETFSPTLIGSCLTRTDPPPWPVSWLPGVSESVPRSGVAVNADLLCLRIPARSTSNQTLMFLRQHLGRG